MVVRVVGSRVGGEGGGNIRPRLETQEIPRFTGHLYCQLECGENRVLSRLKRSTSLAWESRWLVGDGRTSHSGFRSILGKPKYFQPSLQPKNSGPGWAAREMGEPIFSCLAFFLFGCSFGRLLSLNCTKNLICQVGRGIGKEKTFSSRKRCFEYPSSLHGIFPLLASWSTGIPFRMNNHRETRVRCQVGIPIGVWSTSKATM